MKKPIRLLFSGYAPVHFVCFRPLYERLRRISGVTVYFSGGRRQKDGNDLDLHALYDPFAISRSRQLSLKEMRRRTFDIAFSAHTSGYFPARRCPKIQIFHGISFRNVAIRTQQLQYDHLFIIGPYMMRGFIRRKILKKNDSRALAIGFPKLDRLVDGTLDRRKILHDLDLTGRRPVLLYAPTGWKGNSLETMGEEVIARLEAVDRYDVLVKPHDHPKDLSVDWFARLRKFAGPHVKIIRAYDVVPYLYVADALISDASSVSSEYTLLNRPIVFLDVPRVLARARRKGTMLDLTTYGRRTGVTVRHAEDVPHAVAWSLAHPGHGSRIRRAMAHDLFYNPGRATDAALAWIAQRLGARTP